MKISHIEHLGIAVESIEAALPYFENVLGLKCYAVEEVADQKVKTAFLKVGEVKIELLEPTSPDSTIAKFLEKGGRGVHPWLFASKTVWPTLWPSAMKKAFVSSTRLRGRVRRNCRLHSCIRNPLAAS